MPNSRNRVLVEGALAVALSVVFSAIRLWTMPQGGSITLEMVPLFLFALRRGGRAGIAAGAVSGLLQLFTGGYVVHPAQAVLDYPAAFGALGIAGFFPRASWFGMALGGVVRFVCHVLSGVVFFSSFAPEGANVWIYSSVYNGTFLLPTLVITAVLVSLIRPRLARVGQDRE
ncbi:energy-coupled thiamine transporter ThiT [Aminivibrio sp.]|jgi:thiamine transporter|uniref:energy-coupled thiamine transporter ThiT n=1 Tax=Aminivibrio sp. TaxID=1872489 RepID=UPI003D981BE9